MKKLALCMLLACLCLTARSQNAFQDAKTIFRLQNFLKSSSKDTAKKRAYSDTIVAILVKYTDGQQQIKKLDDITAVYEFSDYIKALVKVKGQYILEKPKEYNDIVAYVKGKNGKLGESGQALIDKILTQKNLVDSIKSPSVLKIQNSEYTDADSLSLSTVINSAYSALGQKKLTLTLHQKFDAVKEILSHTDIATIKTDVEKEFKSDATIFVETFKTISLKDQNVSNQNSFNIAANLQEEQLDTKAATQQQAAKSMALPSESELIDAMAIFLVNRVKTEAALAFIDVIKDKLKGDSILLRLFPKSRDLLYNYQSYEAPNFGLAWRHAVAEDIITIPDKLANDPELDRYLHTHLNMNDHFYRFFRLAVKLSSLSRDNANFIDIIEYLNRELNPDDDYMLSSYIRFVQMINNEFYSKDGKSGYWISYGEFAKMQPDEFQVMMALLRQRYPLVFKFLQVKLKVSDNSKLPSAADVQTWMSKIFFIINQYQIAIKNPTEYKDKIHNIGSYWTFITDSFHQFTTKQNNQFIIKVDSSLAIDVTKYEHYVALADSTFQQLAGLYGAIEDKNYPHALEMTVGLMRRLEPADVRYRKITQKYFLAKKAGTASGFSVWYQKPAYKKFYDALGKFQADYEDKQPATVLKKDSIALIEVVTAIKNDIKDSTQFQNAFKNDCERFVKNFYTHYNWYQDDYRNGRYANLIKVATFMNDVMASKNSEDLSKVISTYALPPQSYRLKRTSRHSINLNAYVGVVVGMEGIKYKREMSYGLTAPIGVSFSWSGVSRYKPAHTITKSGDLVYLRGNSNSVSFSLLDIGAVVRYRLGAGTQQGLPEKVYFSQFVSPALQFHWGIRNTPLELIAGFQYLPELRTFEEQPGERIVRSLFYSRVGVVLDIPMMNFYSKN